MCPRPACAVSVLLRTLAQSIERYLVRLIAHSCGNRAKHVGTPQATPSTSSRRMLIAHRLSRPFAAQALLALILVSARAAPVIAQSSGWKTVHQQASWYA